MQSHAQATMARRYDSRTTTFSPEGRLYQASCLGWWRADRFANPKNVVVQ